MSPLLAPPWNGSPVTSPAFLSSSIRLRSLHTNPKNVSIITIHHSLPTKLCMHIHIWLRGGRTVQPGPSQVYFDRFELFCLRAYDKSIVITWSRTYLVLENECLLWWMENLLLKVKGHEIWFTNNLFNHHRGEICFISRDDWKLSSLFRKRGQICYAMVTIYIWTGWLPKMNRKQVHPYTQWHRFVYHFVIYLFIFNFTSVYSCI